MYVPVGLVIFESVEPSKDVHGIRLPVLLKHESVTRDLEQTSAQLAKMADMPEAVKNIGTMLKLMA